MAGSNDMDTYLKLLEYELYKLIGERPDGFSISMFGLYLREFSYKCELLDVIENQVLAIDVVMEDYK